MDDLAEDIKLTADTVVSDSALEIIHSSNRNCPTCGLELPMSGFTCPRDGTTLSFEEVLGAELARRYEFISLIGSGGMGVIYKARQLLLEKVVAIKMLNATTHNADLAVTRFQQEAKAASNLDHPGIIKVYDFGLSEHEQVFMVMEFIEGRTLADVIEKEGPFSIDAALPIFIDICDAVSHAHKHGILHRDIKPSNIMLVNGTNQVKIVDFGIAKIQDKQAITQTGEIFGSPPYMSPEQCLGQRVDHRSDIYSIGCVMYEALTGRPPFEGESMMKTIFMHLSEKPDLLSKRRPDLSFSPQIQQIISSTLEKKPDDRYQNVERIKTDLNKLQQDDLKVAFVNRRTRSDIVRVVIIVVLALIVVIGAILVVSSSDSLRLRDTTTGELDQLSKSRLFPLLSLDAKEAKVNHRPLNDRDLEYLARISTLQNLDLRSTNVTDNGLAKLSNLKDLQRLRLSGTKVSGAGLSNLKQLPKLKALSITSLSITPEGYDALSTLSLNELHASRSPLSDKDLAKISTISSLKELMIYSTKITDDGLKEIGSLKALERLDLSSNSQLTSQALVNLQPLRNLQELNLRYDHIDNEGLHALLDLPNLAKLYLDGTDIDDQGLIALAKIPGLKEVTINGCTRVTTQGISELRKNCPGCKVIE
ncbi:MAG: protein kinase [Cyanobacteria bacterium]|nr:protein kinase [Cyanobacteriota bacterium]